MITRLDNLKEGATKRLLQNWAPALFTCLALVGAVGLPLRSLYSARTRYTYALEDSVRAARLRSELEAFRAAGGEGFVERLDRTTAELLPHGLSSIDVRAALQLLAEPSGFDLAALSVSEFVPTRYATLDDSVGLAEISLSGRGGPGSLARLLDSVRALGYPVTVRNFQLDRLSATDAQFEIHAALDLYQAIPPQAAPRSEDTSFEDE
ncbi:MAG: hypothetical protein H6831_01175 [Planctomycetes bacterium]|nr:hypothetical protein [Planctomycetota bacterium]MCB9902997.1 hypothetical protein [Planctomycetota bacterium]